MAERPLSVLICACPWRDGQAELTCCLYKAYYTLLQLLWYQDEWCCRDGRLKENDQILAINDQVLNTGISHQQAVHILQSATGLVRLLVARSLTSTLPASSAHDEHKDRDVTQQSSPADQPADMVVSSNVGLLTVELVIVTAIYLEYRQLWLGC